MYHQRKINNPYNFAFKVMYEEFPKELHEELHVPGIFKEKASVKACLKDGRILEMDASYIVDPDFIELFETAVVDMEHQNLPVDLKKIIIIGDYIIQQIADERLPPLTVIACREKPEKSEQSFDRTPTNTTKLYFLDLGEEDNNKRLISVSELINNNRDLTTNQALNLGIIVLFAPRYKALEITEKVAKLYLELENLDKKLDFVLYSVIYAMIDAYSITEKDFQRLIAMISKKTADDIKEKFESYRYAMNSLEIAKDSLESVNSSLETVNNNLKTTKNELKTANNNLKNTKNELSETKTKLLDSENANKALKTENLNLETENSNLKNEIFILRQQLANSK